MPWSASACFSDTRVNSPLLLPVVIRSSFQCDGLCVFALHWRQRALQQAICDRLARWVVAVIDIQICTGRVNIFCKVSAAVVSNYAVTGYCADYSFYSYHLRLRGRFIEIPFAAIASAFVTFAKSNAKALLTAKPSKEHCTLQGGMRLLWKSCRLFRFTVSTQTSKNGVVGILFALWFYSLHTAHRHRKFWKSSMPSFSKAANFSLRTGDALRVVSANALPCLPWQEHGTLLSWQTRRSSPMVALRHYTACKCRCWPHGSFCRAKYTSSLIAASAQWMNPFSKCFPHGLTKPKSWETARSAKSNTTVGLIYSRQRTPHNAGREYLRRNSAIW